MFFYEFFSVVTCSEFAGLIFNHLQQEDNQPRPQGFSLKKMGGAGKALGTRLADNTISLSACYHIFI